jgi:hypothetical protein
MAHVFFSSLDSCTPLVSPLSLLVMMTVVEQRQERASALGDSIVQIYVYLLRCI